MIYELYHLYPSYYRNPFYKFDEYKHEYIVKQKLIFIVANFYIFKREIHTRLWLYVIASFGYACLLH